MKAITLGEGLKETIENINLMLQWLKGPKGYVAEELTTAKVHLEDLLYHVKEVSATSSTEVYCRQCKGPCERLLKQRRPYEM